MQVLVPILAAAGFLHRHGMAHCCVGFLETAGNLPPRCICIQTPDNVSDLQMISQLDSQRTIVTAAKCHRVGRVPMKRKITHTADRAYRPGTRMTAGPAHVRRSLIRRLSISTVVWSADPQYLIAQMTQQLRQICSSGNLHFSVCKAISDFA